MTYSKMKVLLFDIDGTLVDTRGAGLNALHAAAKEFFGAESPPLDLAGSTDEGVVRGMMKHFDEKPTRERIESFYEIYLPHLQRELAAEDYAGITFSGVAKLLQEVSSRKEKFFTGLLTGNISAGAWEKVGRHGLSQHFHFGAWGGDHWDRNVLGPIALQRAKNIAGKDFSPKDTIVIGDTPKDIACARAMGAKVIAVATGSFCREQLQDADCVLDSLADTEAFFMACEGD